MTKVASSFSGSIPEYYDTHMGPAIFEPYAANLAQRLAGGIAGPVLETACGTGILTRRLRAHLEAGTRLVATDLSAAMLDYARTRLADLPGVEWREADAANLPFSSASFAAVVCQLGLMFVPDKAVAMREARRVLMPGGLYLFNVWDRLEENPHGMASSRVLKELFPGDPVADFAKVPYGFHDQDLIRALLDANGFGEVVIEKVNVEIRSPSANSIAIGAIRGTPRSLLIQERGVSLDSVIEAVTAELARVGGDHPFRVNSQAIVVAARPAKSGIGDGS